MKFTKELKNQFKSLIAERCGLYFKDHDLKNLENAIIVRMKSCEFDSVPNYYSHLTISEKKEDEFRELMNLLTVHHTYFFRNEPQFKALKEKVLPEIIKNKKTNRGERKEKPIIRIWSAGCSTGEEPYSIAMAIRDIIEDLEEWDVEIYATDASTDALERARKGVYSKNSMKLVDKEHREKYFIEKTNSRQNTSEQSQNSRYEMQDSVKRMVHFDYLNLMDEKFPSGFDVIFCRNVVIYFPLDTTIKVMDRFHSSLIDGGFMFIGYSESLQYISDKFKMVDWGDAIFYRKALKPPPHFVEAPKPVVEKVEEVIEEISRAELQAEKTSEEEKSEVPHEKLDELLVQIIKASRMKKYEEALNIIRKAKSIDKDSIDLYYMAAEIHANQGKFDKAKEQLHFVLKLDALYAPAYYLLGSIHMEEEDLEQSKRNIKKAIYLNKNFAMAYFYLASAYRKEGRPDDAIREYRNTLKVLAQGSPNDMISYSGGFNFATLISVCKNNIERLKAKECN